MKKLKTIFHGIGYLFVGLIGLAFLMGTINGIFIAIDWIAAQNMTFFKIVDVCINILLLVIIGVCCIVLGYTIVGAIKEKLR